MNLPMAAAGLILALGVQAVYSCSYSSIGTYDRCIGVACSYDYQCNSNNCTFGLCQKDALPPWAIAMIVIFSVMFFISIVGAICRRRQHHRRLIVMRNQTALIVRGNDDDHHHHQQNNYQHSHDNTPKTIITAAQIVPQAPAPPMGYVPMPQPVMPYAQPYPQQAYPGQAPPPAAVPGYNYQANYGVPPAQEYSMAPGAGQNLPYNMPPSTDPYYGGGQYNYGQQPPTGYGAQPQTYM